MIAVTMPLAAQSSSSVSLASLSTQPSMNVFRRFAVEPAKMASFYSEVLGLKQLPSLNMPGGGQMMLFQIGSGQVKLQYTAGAGEYKTGAVREVTGLRVFTFFYPDEAAVTARFVQHGYPAPMFRPARGGKRAAMVLDPANQWVELMVAPGASQELYDSIDLGLTVSDLEKSRAFYREFVGLDELPPVEAKVLGTTLYPYRHKETRLFLYEPAGDHVDNGSAGIQYVVRDTPLVDAKAKHRGGIAVETPLNKLAGFDLVTVWLNDPDGVTNYFAQVGPNSRTAQQARAAGN